MDNLNITPVSMGEALEVIEYQQALRSYRKNKPTIKQRIINFFKIK